jgi:SAM-dependent methyltransferase
MLCDVARMDAYERALRRLIEPGDVVLDLGTGTGILAMLAARRGARVHAVESMDVAHTAAKLFAHNGLAIQLHHADITTLAPVEPVCLVVSDLLGVFLVDDRMLPAVEAAGRWLAPGGRFCPSEVRLFVAPVADFTLSTIDVWSEPFYGVDLSPVALDALRVCALGNLPPTSMLASPERYGVFVPPGPAPALDHAMRFVTTRAGRLRALAGWFEAQLAPDVVLSTAPGHETHWGQHLWPLPSRDLPAGAIIEARLWLAGDHWRWAGTIAGEPFDFEESLAA